MIKIHGKITAITQKETKQVTANTARLKKIFKSAPEKQLAKNIAEARRSARTSDRTTKKLAALVPKLAGAAQTYGNAELCYWTWHAAHRSISAEAARMHINLINQQLGALDGLLKSQAESRVVTEDRRGVAQVINESVDRRLEVMQRQSAAVALQIEPLRQVVALLEPFTEPKKA